MVQLYGFLGKAIRIKWGHMKRTLLRNWGQLSMGNFKSTLTVQDHLPNIRSTCLEIKAIFLKQICHFGAPYSLLFCLIQGSVLKAVLWLIIVYFLYIVTWMQSYLNGSHTTSSLYWCFLIKFYIFVHKNNWFFKV